MNNKQFVLASGAVIKHFWLTNAKRMVVVSLITLFSCDSTRTIFKSSDVKENSWSVNAYTLSHCGCTQLFVEKYKGGKKEFEIMYTDSFARKNIYTADKKGTIVDTVALIATAEDFDVPFDSLDTEIFKRIKTIIERREGLVYEMKWVAYKGFIKEE
jgi:hypothetical protein